MSPRGPKMQAFLPESSTMPHPALDAFWQSPVVFYPGFGSDGHPVKFFNSRHLATSFVYADYLMTEEDVKVDLDKPTKEYNGHFRGYHSVERIKLTQADLTPDGWQPHVPSPSDNWARPRIKPYGFLEVMERDAGLDDSHGAQRLSILFLGADGHATYDALFCQAGQRPPYAIALHDHGFGGNYDRFGADGLLERIAMRSRTFPEFLLVASGTKPWDGYQLVPEVKGSRGGMHGKLHHLYRRYPDELFDMLQMDKIHLEDLSWP